MNFDYTLYLVTDRQLMSCDSLTEAVEQAILGGCTMIQLREKELSSLEFYNQAVAVKQVTDKYHIPLIINDRIDIAMAVQATGVHIGQHDLPAAAVRKVIGENMLLGVSASSIAEAIQAQQDGADYLGVGAMFPTGTKTDADSVSMEELQKIRAAVSLPIVVIGGINKGKSDYEIKLKQQEIMQEVGNANMLTKALIDRLINKVYAFPGERIEIEYATQDFLETKESEKEV